MPLHGQVTKQGDFVCLGTKIARLAVCIAFEEAHRVEPDHVRVDETLQWMPWSTFRSTQVLRLAQQ